MNSELIFPWTVEVQDFMLNGLIVEDVENGDYSVRDLKGYFFDFGIVKSLKGIDRIDWFKQMLINDFQFHFDQRRKKMKSYGF